VDEAEIRMEHGQSVEGGGRDVAEWMTVGGARRRDRQGTKTMALLHGVWTGWQVGGGNPDTRYQSYEFAARNGAG